MVFCLFFHIWREGHKFRAKRKRWSAYLRPTSAFCNSTSSARITVPPNGPFRKDTGVMIGDLATGSALYKTRNQSVEPTYPWMRTCKNTRHLLRV